MIKGAIVLRLKAKSSLRNSIDQLRRGHNEKGIKNHLKLLILCMKYKRGSISSSYNLRIEPKLSNNLSKPIHTENQYGKKEQ